MKSPDRDLELDQLYKVWNLLLHFVVLCHFDQMIMRLGEVCSFARISGVTFRFWQVSAQSGSSSVRSLTSR